jgi:mannose-6-phosphate isomerase
LQPAKQTTVFAAVTTKARRLLPTRVYRFYRGGALLGRLTGEGGGDGSFPEDWLGSVTRANNPGREEPDAGLSRLDDGTLLADAIAADPGPWLGARHVERFGPTTGILVKLLDAAERLPVHAHPDRRFAADQFGSPFGKTEAWIVIATRGEGSEVWVGLSEPVEAEAYRRWIESQDRDALLGSLNHVSVQAGDVLYVPAGVPHAIGAGVLIAELQEPTDFSLVCEWDGFPIAPEDSHLGLGWDTALAALDLDAHKPVRGLPAEARSFFWADELVEPAGRFAILLVLEGDGAVDGQPARAGDRFAVPAAAEELSASGSLRVLRCLAPEAE